MKIKWFCLKSWLIISVCLLANLLCSTSYGGVPIKIMPLGDSITRGYGSDFMVGYRQDLFRSLVETGYKIDFVGNEAEGELSPQFFDYDHEGHGGWTPSQVALNVFGWLLVTQPDVILLHIGTNDIKDISGVEKILDEIDRYSSSIVVVLAKIINRQPYHLETSLFNNKLEAMASNRQLAGDLIYIVDMENALNYSTDMSDLLHPNNDGYTKMSRVWHTELVNGVLPLPQGEQPELLNVVDERLFIGETYNLDIDAFGYPVPSYILNSGPAGMTIDRVSGLLQWVPDAPGSFAVTVSAQNSEGVDSQTFTINVEDAPVIPAGLVSYWMLDESSGPVYFDATGLNDGQCSGTCPGPISGLVNGGQIFNGSSGVDVQPDGSFDWVNGESFSVEFWLR
ncbi:GDSL-type esterase/lipase family protein, partial [Desulfocastanea catecholica]